MGLIQDLMRPGLRSPTSIQPSPLNHFVLDPKKWELILHLKKQVICKTTARGDSVSESLGWPALSLNIKYALNILKKSSEVKQFLEEQSALAGEGDYKQRHKTAS